MRCVGNSCLSVVRWCQGDEWLEPCGEEVSLNSDCLAIRISQWDVKNFWAELNNFLLSAVIMCPVLPFPSFVWIRRGTGMHLVPYTLPCSCCEPCWLLKGIENVGWFSYKFTQLWISVSVLRSTWFCLSLALWLKWEGEGKWVHWNFMALSWFLCAS